MRRISMTTRDELVAAIAARYAQGDRIERGRILDEFAAVTGFHRKHAMRLLRAGQPNRRSRPRPGRRVYDDAVREALIVVWEASDRVCGKRLRPLVPILVEAMERHGHLRLAQEVRISLDLHDLVAWGEGPSEPLDLALAGGIQRRLEFDIQRAGSDATAVHRAQHLDVPDRVEAETLRDARLHQFDDQRHGGLGVVRLHKVEVAVALGPGEVGY